MRHGELYAEDMNTELTHSYDMIIRVSGGAATSQATTSTSPERSPGDTAAVSSASFTSSATSRLRIILILLYWLFDFRSTEQLVQLVLTV